VTAFQELGSHVLITGEKEVESALENLEEEEE
jgi:hypothetical protein